MTQFKKCQNTRTKIKPKTKLEFCQVFECATFDDIVDNKRVIFIMRSFDPQNDILVKDQT